MNSVLATGGRPFYELGFFVVDLVFLLTTLFDGISVHFILRHGVKSDHGLILSCWYDWIALRDDRQAFSVHLLLAALLVMPGGASTVGCCQFPGRAAPS